MQRELGVFLKPTLDMFSPSTETVEGAFQAVRDVYNNLGGANTPIEVVATDLNGVTAYTAGYCNGKVYATSFGAYGGDISVIDPSTCTLLKKLSYENADDADLTYNQRTRTVYIKPQRSKAIHAINTATDTITENVYTLDHEGGPAIASLGDWLYVGSLPDTKVIQCVNTRTGEMKNLPIDMSYYWFCNFSWGPDGLLYSHEEGSRVIHAIDVDNPENSAKYLGYNAAGDKWNFNFSTLWGVVGAPKRTLKLIYFKDKETIYTDHEIPPSHMGCALPDGSFIFDRSNYNGIYLYSKGADRTFTIPTECDDTCYPCMTPYGILLIPMKNKSVNVGKINIYGPSFGDAICSSPFFIS